MQDMIIWNILCYNTGKSNKWLDFMTKCCVELWISNDISCGKYPKSHGENNTLHSSITWVRYGAGSELKYLIKAMCFGVGGGGALKTNSYAYDLNSYQREKAI